MTLYVIKIVLYLKEVHQNCKDILGAKSGEKSTKEDKYEKNQKLLESKLKDKKIYNKRKYTRILECFRESQRIKKISCKGSEMQETRVKGQKRLPFNV